MRPLLRIFPPLELSSSELIYSEKVTIPSFSCMKILVAYATLSGNTQMVAEHLTEHLKSAGHDATLINQDDLDPPQMNEYEFVFLGSSTWGDGEPNPTSEVFMGKLKDYTEPYGAVKFAVFGLGDSSYAHFCGIADRLSDLLKEKGKVVVIPNHKIDGYPDDAVLAKICEWADQALLA